MSTEFSQQYPKASGLYWYKLLADSNVHNTRVWEHPLLGLVAAAEESYKSVTKFSRWWSVQFLPEPKEMIEERIGQPTGKQKVRLSR